MNDGGPDAMIEQRVFVPGQTQMCAVTSFTVRFSDAFWRKLYAGLAMQSIILAEGTEEMAMRMSPPAVAATAHVYADAMVAHEAAEAEKGETDGEIVQDTEAERDADQQPMA